MHQISSENFWENNTQALEIQRRLNDRTDTNSMAQLRMHFQRSKTALDGLKSVFNAFKRKPPLGAPAS